MPISKTLMHGYADGVKYDLHPETEIDQILGLARQNSTAYALGAVAFAGSLAPGLVLKCTTAGTTAATEPSLSGVEVGDVISDGAVTWIVQDLLGGGMYIGAVHPFLQTSIPDGWLSCENGQEVSRTAYPELWAWVQANAPLITEAQWQTKAAAQKSVGYYSSGDGSTTFRLPRLIGFFEGVTAANVGAFKSAGLPNVTGTIHQNANRTVILGTTGVFAYNDTGAMTLPQSSSTAAGALGTTISFNASRSSAIYGNSTTVQPESVGMVWCVRAFGAAVNQGTVDITELAQMLNLKLSISDAPRVCTKFAFPSGTYVTLTLSNMPYTAPANGWLWTSVDDNSGGGYLAMMSGSGVNVQFHTYQAGNATWGFIPVRKGDIADIVGGGYSVNEIRFIYAQGEV